VTRGHAEQVEVFRRGGDAVVDDGAVFVLEHQSFDLRPRGGVVEVVEQAQEGDLALALHQEVHLGMADGLLRIEVHVRAAEDDFRFRHRLANQADGLEHVDQREGHRGDAHHVGGLRFEDRFQLFVGVSLGLGVDEFDPETRVLFEETGERENPQRRVEAAVLLDDRGVFPDQLAETRRVDEQHLDAAVGPRANHRRCGRRGDDGQ
jgi:hypothetical protein